jgi:hypothetical protein
MADNTPGVSTDAVQTGFKAVADLMQAAANATNAKDAARYTAAYQLELKKIAATSKVTTTGLGVTVEAFKRLTKANKDTSDTVKLLTEDLAENAGIMSNTTRAELLDRVQQYKAASGTVIGIGKDEKTQRALLSHGAKDANIALARDEIAKKIEIGKSMTGWNKGFASNVEGVLKGVSGRLQMMGQGASEAVGGFLGLDAGLIAGIGTLVGGFAAIWAIFSSMLSAAAQGTQTLAKAHYDISDSNTAALKSGVELNDTLAYLYFSTGLGTEAMEKYIDVANSQYKMTLRQTTATENTQQSMIEFVADMAMMGERFGLSAEDSVKMSSRMMQFSKTSKQVGESSFYKLNMEALNLGTSVDLLMGPFGALAQQAAYTGTSIDYSVGQLSRFKSVMRDLEAKGTVDGFKNMTSEMETQFLTKIADFASKMDDIRFAAITTHPGEGFSEMLNRVAATKGAPRLDQAVNSLAKNQRINIGANATAKDYYILARMMGMTGNFQDLLQSGKFLAAGAHSGRLTEKSIQDYQAQQVDNKIAQAKTTGQMIAMGVDPTAALVTLVKQLLNVVIAIADSASMLNFRDADAKRLSDAKKFTDTKPAPMPPSYGVGHTARPHSRLG